MKPRRTHEYNGFFSMKVAMVKLWVPDTQIVWFFFFFKNEAQNISLPVPPAQVFPPTCGSLFSSTLPCFGPSAVLSLSLSYVT